MNPARKKVRVAIIGVGNCASSLVQGVAFYESAPDDEFVPGLMHVRLGDYHVRDVEFSAAFDIDVNKVGKDLAEAIFAAPNNTYKFSDVPLLDVPVRLSADANISPDPAMPLPALIAGWLREHAAAEEVRLWLVRPDLPTTDCRDLGARLVSGLDSDEPVGLSPRQRSQQDAVRFKERGLPLVGDDIKSQLGATITHRVLAHLFKERGVRLDRTYQLNFGGNTDFLNMLERERVESKKISKTNSVLSQLDYPLSSENAHVGPSDYVPWLQDRKWCYIRMEGTTFGNVPLNCELKLEVWDSPNSAGVVIDAVRCAKLALDRGAGGALVGPSSYLMKSPPQQFFDHEAHARIEAFIVGEEFGGGKIGARLAQAR